MREAVEGTTEAPRRRKAAVDGSVLAHQIVDVLVDRQAADVVMLDLTMLSAFTDYFVVATVDNQRQMQALIESVNEMIDGMSGVRFRQEGAPESGWVLLDVGPVVVHLFGLEERARYTLEGLWSRATEVVRVQ